MTQPANQGIPPQTPVPGMMPQNGTAPPEKEIVYLEGRPLLRAEQAKATMWALVGLVLIALPVLAAIFDWTWRHWWMTVVCVILALAPEGVLIHKPLCYLSSMTSITSPPLRRSVPT